MKREFGNEFEAWRRRNKHSVLPKCIQFWLKTKQTNKKIIKKKHPKTVNFSYLLQRKYCPFRLVFWPNLFAKQRVKSSQDALISNFHLFYQWENLLFHQDQVNITIIISNYSFFFFSNAMFLWFSAAPTSVTYALTCPFVYCSIRNDNIYCCT